MSEQDAVTDGEDNHLKTPMGSDGGEAEPPLKKQKQEKDEEEEADNQFADADATKDDPAMKEEEEAGNVIDPAASIPDEPLKTANEEGEDDDDEEDLFGGDDEEKPAVKEEEGKNASVVAPPTQEAPAIVKSNTVSKVKQESPQKIPEPSSSVAKPEISIPRKSPGSAAKKIVVASPSARLPPAPSGTTAPSKTNSNNTSGRVSGSRFGLPAGVFVPNSIVHSKLLESEMNTPGSKLMDVLKSLPVNLINDALTEYDDAVEIKGSSAIRNHGAYLYGVVKRYVSVHERAMSGEGTGILPMGEDGLTPQVDMRLNLLVSTGFCSSQEMNEKVKSKIRMLSEKDALFALDELSSVERSSIRNFGSYFMGILNRYMRGDASSKARPQQQQQPSFGGGPKSGGQQHGHQFHQQNRGGGGGSQSRLQHRDNKSNKSNFSSSFQSQQQHRGNNSIGDNAYRSDNRSNNNAMNNNNPMFSVNAYGPQHNQQQQLPPPPQMTSWPNQQQPAPQMGGYNNPHMNSGPGMQPAMGMNQQGMISGMQPQQPPNSGYAQQQQPPYMQQQQPPPQQQPPYMQQAPPFAGQQPSGYSQNPQPGMQSQAGGIYQQPQMGQQQPPQTFNQNPMQPSYMQQQQSLANTPMVNPQQSTYGPIGGAPPPLQQQQGAWQQEPLIDILGLADKAASAIQALGGSQTTSGIQQQGYQQPGGATFQQQPGYGLPAYQPNSNMAPQQTVPSQQQQPQQFLPPYQQQRQQQQQQPPQQYGAGSLPNAQRPGNDGAPRRRTTATISELPITVQYAVQVSFVCGSWAMKLPFVPFSRFLVDFQSRLVQNLVATGAVDGQPDEGILGMIVDLPESMALSSLQKFASIDKSSMRNKTAYLAGVLRRELEKIHRR
jgi:Heterogeneous nuclear ribonucleoprotein Q acidic domain